MTHAMAKYDYEIFGGGGTRPPVGSQEAWNPDSLIFSAKPEVYTVKLGYSVPPHKENLVITNPLAFQN